jgi:hypothetical protein
VQFSVYSASKLLMVVLTMCVFLPTLVDDNPIGSGVRFIKDKIYFTTPGLVARLLKDCFCAPNSEIFW